ncbi:MAG TPA: hypothetical protein VK973_13270 [Arenicellales bacterium]|nr:hypothetical protein [Arenicellales bacterium]
MTDITIHTGCAGDQNTICVDWFDHNNVRQQTVIQANIQEWDKPRTLNIAINGVVVGIIPSESDGL